MWYRRGGVLIEPFTVGCRAARRGQPQKGESAVVFGCGTIGLAAAVALKYFGMGKVMLCDVSGFRLGIAKKLGFAIITQEFPLEQISEAIRTAADPERAFNVTIKF